MKTKLIYIIFSFSLLCACSNDEEPATEAQQPCDALELSVSAGDFVTYGDVPDTRATDNGAATTFENGDRVGVIVLEGSALKGNNLPYLYSGGSWSFDIQTVSGENSAGSNKVPYYYDNKATGLTYIVYYPYSKDADGVISIDGENGLKSKFTPEEDQQSKDNYRTSDLMIWQSTADVAPQKTLSATLTHVYNSVSILPEVHYTLGNNEDFVHSSPAISDVNFIMGDKIVYPYVAVDGSYRYILPSGFTGSVRCFYTFEDETYGKEFTIPASTSAPANTRYSSVQKVSAGTYSLDMARLGDFYCRNSSGEGYLIPNEAESLPAGTNCIGIVYWLGDIKGDNYGLLDSKFPSGTHGLVVALWDMPALDNASSPTMTWTYGGYEYVNNWLGSQNNITCTWNDRPSGFSSIQVTDKMQGYANTLALIEYNEYVEGQTGEGYGQDGNKRVKPVKGLVAFQDAHPAPSNSSGWYWPSVYELKYVCWGQGNGGGTSGKSMLNTKIGKLGGNVFDSDNYWSSTECSDNDNRAWYVYIGDGYVNDVDNKSCDLFRVRPLLAF
ncbi:fimbrillin family protein [Parabacteroides sp.]